jgi:predicted metal-dependent hydrolase
MEIILLKERRKTLSLKHLNGNFILKVPLKTKKIDVQRFLDKNKSWMDKILEQYESFMKLKENLRFSNGEMLLFLGKNYEIKLVQSSKPLEFNGAFLLSDQHLEDPRKIFKNFYKEQLKLILPEILRSYSIKTGFTYRSFSITNALKRWGSCNSENKLNFSWLLMMAPRDVIEYVVVHELVHTKIKSHGGTFWAEVEKTVPDWRTKRKWLNDHYNFIIAIT